MSRAWIGAGSERVVLRPPGGESEAAGDGDDPAPVDYDAEPSRAVLRARGLRTGCAPRRGSREWNRDDLASKAVVLGVERDGAVLGFPRRRVLDAGGAVRATVGETSALVLADGDVGIRAFRDPGYEFRSTGDPGGFAADGTVWDAATGRAEDGRRLERLPTRRLFAFAWQDDHGPDSFWTRGRATPGRPTPSSSVGGRGTGTGTAERSTAATGGVKPDRPATV